jgi:signal transduction histidine kinase
MELTQQAFIYLAVSFFSFVFCYLTWLRRLVPGAWELCLLTMTTGFWAFTLFCESLVQAVELKLLWAKVSYTFVTTSPVIYLLFMLKFTGRTALKYWPHRLFLFVVPLITIVLTWNNEYHHLVWKSWEPLATPHDLLQYERGIWFWIGILFYSYLMMFLATKHLLVFLYRNKSAFGHSRSVILVIGSLTPWISSVLLVFGLNQSWASMLTPFLVLMTGAVFTLVVFYAGFYNFLPVAREVVVEKLPDGIIALDKLNRVQDINSRARSMLGLSATSSGLVDLKALNAPYHSLGVALLDKDTTVWELRQSNQLIVSYQLDKVPIQVSTGCRVIIIRDMTEQKQAEKAILEAKEKAEASDQLKSAFLANMSHEIRTPMNSILGFVSLMLDEGVDEAEQRTYLTIVKQNSERLLGTLNDILDLSRIEAGQVTVQLSDFNLMDLLNNVVLLHSKQAEDKQLTLIKQCQIPPELMFVHTDKEKVFSIFSNLVSNAIKFTAVGSVELTCSLTSNRLTLSVKDTGVGVASHKQTTIFERFVQGDISHNRPYEGSGLGLAITKSYVDMLGGTISLESEEGKGSVFRVFIPIKQAEQVAQGV